MKQIIGSLLIMFVVACNEGFKEITFKSENSTIFEERFLLEENGRFEAILDEETAFSHYSTRIDSTLNQEYFSFINAGTNTLYIYDYETSRLDHKVKLDDDGPNGFGDLRSAAHMIISLDSILIYNLWTGMLQLTNTAGEVYWKENITRFSDEVSPNPRSFSPLVKVNNDIFLSCSLNTYKTDYSKTPIVLKINLQTRVVAFVYTLSEVYNSGYWGSPFKYNVAFDFNNRTKKIVLNYPIDPFLHVTSLDGRENQRYYESSKYIKSMKPFKKDINYGIEKDHNAADIKQKEYGLSTSDFMKIIYDPYRNVYYRVAYIRPSIESLRSGNRAFDFSVSVLNENFIKVAERKFDGKTYGYGSYILLSSKGLNIARKDLYNSNEDLITYSIFTLNDKKER